MLQELLIIIVLVVTRDGAMTSSLMTGSGPVQPVSLPGACGDGTPSGILSFLGVGYDIIDGNPEGGDITNGGVDPGLKTTYPIFRLTCYNEDRQDGYLIPDQVDYSPRNSYVSQQDVFYGTQSYMEKLENDIDREGNSKIKFGKFSRSKHYESVEQGVTYNNQVYYEDKTVVNRGQARYKTASAAAEKYPLDSDFVAEACRLPAVYDETAYMQFLQSRGTHVVTKVDLGEKTIDRYQELTEGFVHYAMEESSKSVSFLANFKGYKGGFEVNMDDFKANLRLDMAFGSKTYTFVSGGEDFHEPIRVTLSEVDAVFGAEYWTLFDDYVAGGYCDPSWAGSLTSVATNVGTTLENYAVWRNAQWANDPDHVAIPVAWPYGKYTLPKPTTGCPNTHFTWPEGMRYHDTEDSDANNWWTASIHLYGYRNDNNMEQWFCSKTDAEEDVYGWTFQPGTYCVMRKEGSCPVGFDDGSLHWDDEDKDNENRIQGELPDGAYGTDTDIRYCCRNDGEASDHIYLPTDDNFYLFAYNHQCQEVYGMRYDHEYFRWDNEDRDNADSQSGGHPADGVESDGDDISLTYCYYTAI